MQKTFTLKSLVVLAALALGASCASAKDNQSSFDDVLKSDLSKLETDLGLVHGSAQEFRFIELLALVESDIQKQLGRRFEQNSGHHNAKHDDDRFEDRDDSRHAFEGKEHNQNGGGISISPVSEPATDAMLLAGLVVVGTLVRRKSKPALGNKALAA